MAKPLLTSNLQALKGNLAGDSIVLDDYLPPTSPEAKEAGLPVPVPPSESGQKTVAILMRLPSTGRASWTQCRFAIHAEAIGFPRIPD